ncbi:MAG: CbbQ/NirQ/NorQ C-terminal domain-containing protein, partial [Gammaproteobacteria bacterium]|nr:CbbQ/NirQ/NorQ C-terminal domain-containing protein [Gammaproteobacteria bacterium]
STRLLVYAATLMNNGIEAKSACQMALVTPITDDKDIRDTLIHSIDSIFG